MKIKTSQEKEKRFEELTRAKKNEIVIVEDKEKDQDQSFREIIDQSLEMSNNIPFLGVMKLKHRNLNSMKIY